MKVSIKTHKNCLYHNKHNKKVSTGFVQENLILVLDPQIVILSFNNIHSNTRNQFNNFSRKSSDMPTHLTARDVGHLRIRV